MLNDDDDDGVVCAVRRRVAGALPAALRALGMLPMIRKNTYPLPTNVVAVCLIKRRRRARKCVWYGVMVCLR